MENFKTANKRTKINIREENNHRNGKYIKNVSEVVNTNHLQKAEQFERGSTRRLSFGYLNRSLSLHKYTEYGVVIAQGNETI